MSSLGFNALAAGQAVFAPAGLLDLSPHFEPMTLRGLKIDPADPFKLYFILDAAESGLGPDQLKQESARLIRYFLSGLTVPQKDLWVNLSPFEPEQIIPEALGRTDLGEGLLSQDYLLKQLSASLTHPDNPLGKKFWDKVYRKVYRRFGTTQVPVDTFSKIWIMPADAQIYQQGGQAYVTDVRLKVMLEQDCGAIQNSKLKIKNRQDETAAAAMREVIVPAIEEEVNNGKNFAQLRQMTYVIVLAAWFKAKLKESVLGKVYADKNKVSGVDTADPAAKEKIYQAYLSAYQQGLYDFVRKEYAADSGKQLKRRYFSGGYMMPENIIENAKAVSRSGLSSAMQGRNIVLARVQCAAVTVSPASRQKYQDGLTYRDFKPDSDMAKFLAKRYSNPDTILKLAEKDGYIAIDRETGLIALLPVPLESLPQTMVHYGVDVDPVSKVFGPAAGNLPVYLRTVGSPVVVGNHFMQETMPYLYSINSAKLLANRRVYIDIESLDRELFEIEYGKSFFVMGGIPREAIKKAPGGMLARDPNIDPKISSLMSAYVFLSGPGKSTKDKKDMIQRKQAIFDKLKAIPSPTAIPPSQVRQNTASAMRLRDVERRFRERFPRAHELMMQVQRIMMRSMDIKDVVTAFAPMQILEFSHAEYERRVYGRLNSAHMQAMALQKFNPAHFQGVVRLQAGILRGVIEKDLNALKLNLVLVMESGGLNRKKYIGRCKELIRQLRNEIIPHDFFIVGVLSQEIGLALSVDVCLDLYLGDQIAPEVFRQKISSFIDHIDIVEKLLDKLVQGQFPVKREDSGASASAMASPISEKIFDLAAKKVNIPVLRKLTEEVTSNAAQEISAVLGREVTIKGYLAGSTLYLSALRGDVAEVTDLDIVAECDFEQDDWQRLSFTSPGVFSRENNRDPMYPNVAKDGFERYLRGRFIGSLEKNEGASFTDIAQAFGWNSSEDIDIFLVTTLDPRMSAYETLRTMESRQQDRGITGDGFFMPQSHWGDGDYLIVKKEGTPEGQAVILVKQVLQMQYYLGAKAQYLAGLGRFNQAIDDDSMIALAQTMRPEYKKWRDFLNLVKQSQYGEDKGKYDSLLDQVHARLSGDLDFSADSGGPSALAMDIHEPRDRKISHLAADLPGGLFTSTQDNVVYVQGTDLEAAKQIMNAGLTMHDDIAVSDARSADGTAAAPMTKGGIDLDPDKMKFNISGTDQGFDLSGAKLLENPADFQGLTFRILTVEKIADPMSLFAQAQ